MSNKRSKLKRGSALTPQTVQSVTDEKKVFNGFSSGEGYTPIETSSESQNGGQQGNDINKTLEQRPVSPTNLVTSAVPPAQVNVGGQGSQSFQESRNGGQSPSDIFLPEGTVVGTDGATRPVYVKQNGQLPELNAGAVQTGQQWPGDGRVSLDEWNKAVDSQTDTSTWTFPDGNIDINTLSEQDKQSALKYGMVGSDVVRFKELPYYSKSAELIKSLDDATFQSFVDTTKAKLDDPEVTGDLRAAYLSQWLALVDSGRIKVADDVNKGKDIKVSDTGKKDVNDDKVVNGTNVKGSNDGVVNETPEFKVNDQVAKSVPAAGSVGRIDTGALLKNVNAYQDKFKGKGKDITDEEYNDASVYFSELGDESLLSAMKQVMLNRKDDDNSVLPAIIFDAIWDRGYKYDPEKNAIVRQDDGTVIKSIGDIKGLTDATKVQGKNDSKVKDETVVQGTDKNVGNGTDGKVNVKKDDADGKGTGNDGDGSISEDDLKKDVSKDTPNMSLEQRVMRRFFGDKADKDVKESVSKFVKDNSVALGILLGEIDDTEEEIARLQNEEDNRELKYGEAPKREDFNKESDATKRAREYAKYLEDKKANDSYNSKEAQNRRKILTGIADVIAHVANIWGAVEGATPAQLSSLTAQENAAQKEHNAKVDAAIEKANKDLMESIKNDSDVASKEYQNAIKIWEKTVSAAVESYKASGKTAGAKLNALIKKKDAALASLNRIIEENNKQRGRIALEKQRAVTKGITSKSIVEHRSKGGKQGETPLEFGGS